MFQAPRSPPDPLVVKSIVDLDADLRPVLDMPPLDLSPLPKPANHAPLRLQIPEDDGGAAGVLAPHFDLADLFGCGTSAGAAGTAAADHQSAPLERQPLGPLMADRPVRNPQLELREGVESGIFKALPASVDPASCTSAYMTTTTARWQREPPPNPIVLVVPLPDHVLQVPRWGGVA